MDFKIITQKCKIENNTLTLFLRVSSNNDISSIDQVIIYNIKSNKNKIIYENEIKLNFKNCNTKIKSNNISNKEEEYVLTFDFSNQEFDEIKENFNKNNISFSFNIKYKFTTNENKSLDSVYKLIIKKENSKILDPIESIKKYNKTLIINYFLLILLYVTWFFWNSFNDNVYYSWFSQEFINVCLTGIILFLGIDINTVVSTLKFGNIGKFISHPSVLINEDLKLILNNYKSTMTLLAFLIISVLLIYHCLLPINIVVKNKEFTAYIKYNNKYKKLDTKKIYSYNKNDLVLLYSTIDENNILNIEKPIDIAKLNTSFLSLIYSFFNNTNETLFEACKYKYKSEDGSCGLKNRYISFFNPQDSLIKIKCYTILLKNLKNNTLSFTDSIYLISFDKKINEIKLQLKSTKTQATMQYSSLINMQIDEILLPDSLLFKTENKKYKILLNTFDKELKKEINRCFCHPNKETLMEAYKKLQNIIEEKCHSYPRNLTLIWLIFDHINHWEKKFGIREFDEKDLNTIIKKTFNLFEKNKDKLPDEIIKVSYIKFSIFLRKIFNIDMYSENLFNFSKDLIKKLTDKKLPHLYQHYIEILIDLDLDIINKEEELFLDSLVQKKPMGVQFYAFQKNKCKNKNTTIYNKLNQWENLIKKGIPIDKLKYHNIN